MRIACNQISSVTLIFSKNYGIGAEIGGIKDFCEIHIECHYTIQDAYVSNMPFFNLRLMVMLFCRQQ